MKCPKQIRQIKTDLSKFKDIHLENVANEAIERFGQNHALVHYAIIDNEVSLHLYLLRNTQKLLCFLDLNPSIVF